MKTFVIRAFVVALALTGAAATAHSRTQTHAGVNVILNPVPMCPPNDPNGCGLQ